SLSALGDALASDPFNPQILAVHEELVEVIKETEEGLLNLKRARLLREADSALNVSNQAAVEEVKAEALNPDDAEVACDDRLVIDCYVTFSALFHVACLLELYKNLMLFCEGMRNYSLKLIKQHLLFPVTNARPPECRYASSFCNKDVDLVLIAAYRTVCCSLFKD
ncbi:hypothetical protein Goklo_010288, partial [Gossypium klotzschianum]|nr:hypothetical protein [Gossypium klotzschianum]